MTPGQVGDVPEAPPALPSAAPTWLAGAAGYAPLVLAALAAIVAAWAASDFLIAVVASIVLAVLLWPAVLLAQRVLRLRVLAALLMVSATLAFVVGLTWVVGTQLSEAADQVPDVMRLVSRDVTNLAGDSARTVRRARSALEELDRSVAKATGTPRAPPHDGPAATRSPSLVTQIVGWVGSAVLAVSKAFAGAALQCGVIALLTFFVLCSAEVLVERVLAWCSSIALVGERCTPFMAEVARQVRVFMRVTVVTNVCIGASVALGLALFGVPNPMLWGIAAGTLHFVPYAGLAVMMGLAALEVYAVQSSLWMAAAAAGYVLVVGIVIGTALNVWLQGRMARIDNAVLFAGTLFWSMLWGAWGLVLGPLMVVIGRVILSAGPSLVVTGSSGVDDGAAVPAAPERAPPPEMRGSVIVER